MSKAFTREDSQAPDEPIVARPNPALPPGATNWMTADGAGRLQEEVRMLRVQREGSHGAAAWKRALAQRLADLEFALSTAQIVTPSNRPCDEVRFGMTVKVLERAGGEHTYRIVGVDESDPERGWVSWVSPIARALLGARRGGRVALASPTGKRELAILAISDEPEA